MYIVCNVNFYMKDLESKKIPIAVGVENNMGDQTCEEVQLDY